MLCGLLGKLLTSDISVQRCLEIEEPDILSGQDLHEYFCSKVCHLALNLLLSVSFSWSVVRAYGRLHEFSIVRLTVEIEKILSTYLCSIGYS